MATEAGSRSLSGPGTATAAIFGTNGHVLAAGATVSAALHACGLNTGNLLYQYAIDRLLVNPRLHLVPGSPTWPSAASLSDSADVVCIPAANQINPAWDHAWQADYVERAGLPVTIAGLGAQADLGESTSLDLTPGTVRYLHVLSDRSRHIGVRGHFTRDVLASHGISNTVVTGCPSAFISDVTGAEIAARVERARSRQDLTVNHLRGTLEESCRSVEMRLLTLCREQSLRRVICQTDPLLITGLLAGRVNSELAERLRWERTILAPDLGPGDYTELIMDKGRCFMSAPAWLDAVGRDDVSVGMRFHGAVAAIQGGSLGICVVFDRRTLELAETMAYPFVLASEVENFESLHELLAAVRFDPAKYDTNRSALRANLRLALESSGIVTRLSQ